MRMKHNFAFIYIIMIMQMATTSPLAL